MLAKMRKDDLIMLLEYAYQGISSQYSETVRIYGEDESHESVLEYLGELNSTTEHNIDLLSATDIDEIKLV